MNRRTACVCLTTAVACVLAGSALGAAPTYELVETFPTLAAGAPVGVVPLVLTPDGSRIYGVYSDVIASNHWEINVLVIDATTGNTLETIPLGRGGNIGDAAISLDGTRVYVPVSGIISSGTPSGAAARVEVIDTSTNSVVASVPTTCSVFAPAGVAVTPDGGHLYVAGAGCSTIQVVETTGHTVTANVNVGPQYMGIAVSPDGSRVYAVNRSTQKVSVIDTVTNSQIATIATTNGTGSRTWIAIHPDGSRAYTTLSTSSVVSVLDLVSNTEYTTVPTTGSKLLDLGFTADGSTLLVASRNVDEVVVIDTDPLSPTVDTQIGSVAMPGGSEPWGVAVAPGACGGAFVSLATGDAIAVLSCTARVPVTTPWAFAALLCLLMAAIPLVMRRA